MFYFSAGGERALDGIHRVLKRGGRSVNVDALVGTRMVDYVKQLGFKSIGVAPARVVPLKLKMLVATR